MYKITVRNRHVASFAHLRDAIRYGITLTNREHAERDWKARIVRIVVERLRAPCGGAVVVRQWQIKPETDGDINEMIREILYWETIPVIDRARVGKLT